MLGCVCAIQQEQIHSVLFFEEKKTAFVIVFQSLADGVYLGISVCSQRFSFLSKVCTYNIHYGFDTLTNGSGENKIV